MRNHSFSAVILTIAAVVQGQELQPPHIAIKAENEDFLRQYAETYRFTLGRPRSAVVTPDGSAVLFLRSQPRSFVQDLYEFDCRTGSERVLLTADKILAG